MNRFIQLVLLMLIASAISAQKYVLVWSDEFNKPGLPDSTKWGYEVGKIRNNELQYYTYKRLENARIEDTVLVLEARKEKFNGADYTSASILSKGIGDWKYGKIEISAKVPTGKGTWPALWMMPTNSEYGGWPRSGEIDIMEYIGVEPQKLHYTCHFEGTDGTGHQYVGTNSSYISNPFNQFIKFTLIWTPEKLEWYANDRKFHEYRKQPGIDYRRWPFDKEFYLILNLAYGGSWGGYAGVDDTKLPHKFLIDYVRVYQLQDTDGPFNLDITPANHGKVEISPKLDLYPENTEVTLTAIPDSGYSFKAWEFQGKANPYTFIIAKNSTFTPIFYNPKELLANNEFNISWKPWTFYVENSQNFSYTTEVKDSVFVIDIAKTTGTDWHLGFQELGLSLKKASYKLTFDAWAEQSKQLLITVSKNYSDWSAWVTKYQVISTTRKKYEITINMPVNDPNVRLYFGIGRFSGKFYIDNISLTQIEPTTGIQEIYPDETGFTLYPNPAQNSFKVKVPGFSGNKENTIEILSLDGKLIYQSRLLYAETEISCRKIKPGIYIVRIMSDNHVFTNKLVVEQM